MAAVKNKKLLEIKSEKQSNWLVKIAAYKSKQKAEEINDRLRYSYKSYIKYFPKSQYYSLRVGPYEDKEEALKDQQKLNKLLHIKTNLVKM
jgi:cell division septation protein DedD